MYIKDNNLSGMRCPKLEDLPPAQPERDGWPWNQESSRSSNIMPEDTFWPKFSIVTPSFNQVEFLEETIRSTLLQGYPNLEYIIIDGGSTDGSIDIIKKYGTWLTYWTSEEDKGQSHAINKGFARASGDIFAYINSDDFYEPNALQNVAPLFAKNSKQQLVAGECTIFAGNIIKSLFEPAWPENLSYFLEKTYSSTFAQPASFWSKSIYKKLGGFSETLNFCFDREFFLRMGIAGVEPCLIPTKIARFREHSKSKSMAMSAYFHRESILILQKHASACGIGNKRIQKITKKITNEIRYEEVFATWKSDGRMPAILKFISMVCKSPNVLCSRKILGQARRLISYRAKNVEELCIQKKAKKN